MSTHCPSRGPKFSSQNPQKLLTTAYNTSSSRSTPFSGLSRYPHNTVSKHSHRHTYLYAYIKKVFNLKTNNKEITLSTKTKPPEDNTKELKKLIFSPRKSWWSFVWFLLLFICLDYMKLGLTVWLWDRSISTSIEIEETPPTHSTFGEIA